MTSCRPVDRALSGFQHWVLATARLHPRSRRSYSKTRRPAARSASSTTDAACSLPARTPRSARRAQASRTSAMQRPAHPRRSRAAGSLGTRSWLESRARPTARGARSRGEWYSWSRWRSGRQSTLSGVPVRARVAIRTLGPGESCGVSWLMAGPLHVEVAIALGGLKRLTRAHGLRFCLIRRRQWRARQQRRRGRLPEVPPLSCISQQQSATLGQCRSYCRLVATPSTQETSATSQHSTSRVREDTQRLCESCWRLGVTATW